MKKKKASNEDICNKCSNLSCTVDMFVREIESLHSTIDVIMPKLLEMDKATSKEKKAFLKDNAESKTIKGKKLYKIRIDKHQEFEVLNDKHSNTTIAVCLTPQTFVVSMISAFDSYISHLIKRILYLKDEIINSSDKSLTFSQLKKINNIEEAINYMIDKEIETLLRKSHSEQFSWMEKTFGLTLTKDLNIWPTFIELTERRNLFVHNGGKVNNNYLENCKKHKITLEDGIEVGDRLCATPDYIRTTYKILFEIGVKLAHVLWRKLFPNDINTADDSLSKVCYRLLLKENYSLVISLLSFFLLVLNKFSDDYSRRVSIINLAIAYKFSGDKNSMTDLLSKYDWSSCETIFQIAIRVLKDQYNEAAKIMQTVNPSDKKMKVGFKEFPLYKEFRKSDIFIKTYKDIYDEDCIITDISDTSDANECCDSNI